jgi:hypothetical protein
MVYAVVSIEAWTPPLAQTGRSASLSLEYSQFRRQGASFHA